MQAGKGTVMKRKHHGFTLVELLVVVAIIALLVSILLPTLSRAKELTKRTICGTNLSGAAKSLYIYANDYDDRFPTRGFPNTVRFDVIGWELTSEKTNANSNSRNIFLAVRLGYIEPNMLTCPSTTDATADKASGSNDYYDFNVGNGSNYKNKLSYSYHLQFAGNTSGDVGYPIRSTSASGMALLADKNPCVVYPGSAVGEGCLSASIGKPSGVSSFSEANSENHSGDGQNVVFVDSHVEWTDKPTVGPDNDNIYTVWSGTDRENGTIAGASLPQDEEDSFLVP